MKDTDQPLILYEDNHFLLIDKPPMWLTQPAGKGALNLEEWGKSSIRTNYLHAIHRLDKEVRGIVLFAKTSKALSRLNQSMREGAICKTYRAFCEEGSLQDEGVLDHFLEHTSHKSVVSTERHGKRARLSYRVLERKQGTALVEITLHTGRYHQIRSQFSIVGAPILGDKKYGSHMQFTGSGIALCHSTILFPHPISKLPVAVHSSLL